MATGIPGSNGPRGFGRSGGGISFRLEYEGKASVPEVLASRPGSLRCLASLDGSPKNRLVYGENLAALRGLMADAGVAGQVRLIYIDPPYATRSRFECRKQNHAYEDALGGAEYLEFLRRRLILMRELLAEDGSIYLHLDDNMAFPVKVIMDELFGPRNFRNWITRKKCNPKNYTRKQYGNVADYILFYTKSEEWVWNQPRHDWDEEWARREYPYFEEGTGRQHKRVPIHAPGVRNGATGQPWRGMLPPPGKHWQYLPEKLEKMDARGEIYWSSNGNPRRKVYLDESNGVPIQDIWLEFRDAHNQNIHVTGYPTEKNLDLLKRIIRASSNPEDLVLDAFAGSGTTVVAAEELGRRWIAVDNSLLAIDTMVRRLARGSEPMGDFVSGKGNGGGGPRSLFNADRVLRTGLDLYTEESSDLEPVPAARLEEWTRLLTED
jgi:adenine-specific DNA-methyltransferase